MTLDAKRILCCKSSPILYTPCGQSRAWYVKMLEFVCFSELDWYTFVCVLCTKKKINKSKYTYTFKNSSFLKQLK